MSYDICDYLDDIQGYPEAEIVMGDYTFLLKYDSFEERFEIRESAEPFLQSLSRCREWALYKIVWANGDFTLELLESD